MPLHKVRIHNFTCEAIIDRKIKMPVVSFLKPFIQRRSPSFRKVRVLALALSPDFRRTHPERTPPSASEQSKNYLTEITYASLTTHGGIL